RPEGAPDGGSSGAGGGRHRALRGASGRRRAGAPLPGERRRDACAARGGAAGAGQGGGAPGHRGRLAHVRRVVHLSTVAVYGRKGDEQVVRPADGYDPFPELRGDYAWSKIGAERWVDLY